MSRPVKFYPGPNRTTVCARSRKHALAKLRAFPMDYEVYGMMTQGSNIGNFGVDATCIEMFWRLRSPDPRVPVIRVRRKYSRK